MAMKGYTTFTKFQHYWSLTMRLFSAISRTLVGGILHLRRDAVGVFYCPNRLGNLKMKVNFSDKVWGPGLYRKRYDRAVSPSKNRSISMAFRSIKKLVVIIVLNTEWTISKATNFLFNRHFCFGKYSFSLDTFWTRLIRKKFKMKTYIFLKTERKYERKEHRH